MGQEVEKPMIHGGAVDEARLRYPGAPEPWIDLSTGINPKAYPLPPIPHEAWARLPLASDLADLRSAAARRYGAATVESVVVAAGTQPLLRLLPEFVPSGRVFILGPTYAEHHKAWTDAGFAVEERGDLAAAQDATVVVIVNPDNPTGRLIDRSVLRDVARDLAARGGLLIVDEAFMDVMPDGASLASDLPGSTVVLRSFGKAYGLGGLRLSFAIAQSDLAARLNEILAPWPVSGPALVVGARALSDDFWIDAARQHLQTEAERLDAVLAGAGLTTVGGTPLFRLVNTELAAEISDTLAKRGILVRRFPSNPRWLRFGLPGNELAWERLSAALRRG